MRIWSIHPRYLDRIGLIACWREGLLAKKVLEGNTKGYKNHPQLIRFKQTPNPLAAINNYLHYIVDEAESRGYHFNRSKLAKKQELGWEILISHGQLNYEFNHLKNKLKIRDSKKFKEILKTDKPEKHPLFSDIDGGIANWEVVD